MSGAPNNRAINKTQHFSAAGVSTELVRQIRVHVILEGKTMGELLNEALELYLNERKKRNAK